MAPVSPPGVAASRGSMFSSLQHRDFRLVWAGSLCASMAMNVQQAARGWLIFEMTHSAARLSWVVISFTLPQLLFALFGGALADRLPKKQLMIAAQSLNFVAACGMAYVIFSHEVTFWHFIALGIFNGTVLALSMPSRQSIIPELVGDTDLVNAIALNTASMNLSRILGPVVAGLTIAAFHIDGQIPYFGAGLSYVLIAALYFMGVMTLTRVTIAARPSRVGARPGMLKDIGAGIAYIRNSKIMLGLVATGTLPMMFGQPMQNLIPAFNTTVVHGGPLGNGLLLAATGSGAIFGTLLFAKYGDSGRKGRLLFAGLAMWGIGIALFSRATVLPVALALAAFAAIFSSSLVALNRTLMQLHAPADMRGRIMSFDMMSNGLMPLGVVPIAYLADAIGVGSALLVSAACLLAITAGLYGFAPQVRSIDTGRPALPRVVPGAAVAGD